MAVIPGTPGPDPLDGTELADTITGQGGDDTIHALAGDDSVLGGAGNDYIDGGSGNDTLLGGDGADTLSGGADGADVLQGALGDDVLTLLAGSPGLTSTVSGGAGIDTLQLFWADDPSAVSISLASRTASSASGLSVTFSGIERLVAQTGNGADTILGGNDNDSVFVQGGANVVDLMGGDDTVAYVPNTASTLSGGAGDDLLEVYAADFPLYFIVDAQDGSVDDGQLSVIDGFERYAVHGGATDDIAVTGAGSDFLYGLGGSDTLVGGGGNDSIWGGRGDDLIRGGGGNDRLGGDRGADSLFGGAGRDILNASRDGAELTGGAGDDRFVFRTNALGPTWITDFESGSDQLVLAAFYAPGYGVPGPLPADRLSFDAAVGTQGQFILSYDGSTDRSVLVWDRNGSTPAGGVDLITYFSGHVTLVASDIVLV